MEKLKLAYAAGVIDSDGSITIAVDRWRVKAKGIAPAYQEMVAISQCDVQALELLQELFGGRLSREKARTDARRDLYRWQVRSKIAAEAIKTLLPFLRIKRRQAEIVLALRAIKDRGREMNTELRNGRARYLKTDVLAEMESLVRQVRELNDTRFPLPLG